MSKHFGILLSVILFTAAAGLVVIEALQIVQAIR